MAKKESKVLTLPTNQSDNRSVELQFAMEIKNATFKDRLPIYSVSNSIIHEWNGIYHSPIEPDEIDKKAWDWLCANKPSRANPKIAENCAKGAVLSCDKLPKYNDDDLIVIPTQSKYLCVDKAGNIKVKEPARHFGITYALNCEYSPNDTAPLFLEFLNNVLPDDETRNYLQEYVGYTLLPDCRHDKAIFLLGSGANGKTTLARIISQLHQKTASPALDDLTGFSLESLIGASLIYCDETPHKINEQQLKKIISGSLLEIDIKHRRAITFNNTAKMLILGNHLPNIVDQSDGFWRRLTVIEFMKKFKEDEADPLLAHKIVDNELSGVLNWAIDGLIRLIKQGKFSRVPELSNQAKKAAKSESNSVLGWIDDENVKVASDEAVWNTKDDIYARYKNWCLQNGFKANTSPQFFKMLKSGFSDIKETQRIQPSGERKREMNIEIYTND